MNDTTHNTHTTSNLNSRNAHNNKAETMTLRSSTLYRIPVTSRSEGPRPHHTIKLLLPVY
jgi:hypothetical protein